MSSEKRKYFTRIERGFLAVLGVGFFFTAWSVWSDPGMPWWMAAMQAAAGALFIVAALRGWLGAPWSDRLGDSRRARG